MIRGLNQVGGKCWIRFSEMGDPDIGVGKNHQLQL
jgi:hypothetical protein